MPLSDELAAQFVQPDDAVVWHETLELRHPTLAAPIYLTNRPASFSAKLEAGSTGGGATVLFQSLPFKIELAKRDADGRQDVACTMSNVGRQAMSVLETIKGEPTSPLVVRYRRYLSNDLTGPQDDPPQSLAATTIVATRDEISMTLSKADVQNRPFPRLKYRRDTHPGLAR